MTEKRPETENLAYKLGESWLSTLLSATRRPLARVVVVVVVVVVLTLTHGHNAVRGHRTGPITLERKKKKKVPGPRTDADPGRTSCASRAAAPSIALARQGGSGRGAAAMRSEPVGAVRTPPSGWHVASMMPFAVF